MSQHVTLKLLKTHAHNHAQRKKLTATKTVSNPSCTEKQKHWDNPGKPIQPPDTQMALGVRHMLFRIVASRRFL